MSEVQKLSFLKGATILVQDSANHGYFYIVQKGTISIHSAHEFSDKELSRFEAGDTFGLVSALTVRKHLATLKAENSVDLIKIPVSMLGKYMRSNRSICLKMLNLYSQELKALDKYLAQINESTDSADNPEKLFANAEIYEKLMQPKLAAYAYLRYIEYLKNSDKAKSGQIEKARQKYGALGIRLDLDNVHESHKRQLNPDDIVFVENEPSHQGFIILRGSLRISKLVRGREFVIAVLGDGEIVGEQSLLHKRPYSATAVATEPTELLALSEGDFFEKVGENVLQKMFESLAHRIWFSHQRFAILKLPNAIARLYSFLLYKWRVETRTFDAGVKPNTAHTFLFSFDDLQKMCGLLKVKDESIRAFATDHNLEITEKSIAVYDISKLEDKVLSYKRRASGNASLV